MDRREVVDRLLSAVFPKRCVLCRTVVAYEQYWCGVCALPVNQVGCEFSGGQRQAVDKAVSPFLYQDKVKAAVLRLKEKPDERLAAFFAKQMKQALQEQLPGWSPAYLTAVPSVDQQAYNHARLLAQKLSEEMGLPLLEHLLYRSAKSKEQHTLTQEQRLQNAKQSYHRRQGARIDAAGVLLVDDVLTTGATAVACAESLLAAGAKSIVVVTAAYTPLLQK